MKTGRGPDGRQLLVVGRTDGELRVRDPATGSEETVPAEQVDRLDREPLAVVRDAVTDGLDEGRPIGTDDRTVGLAVEFVDRGPTPVRRLTASYDACESDLNGMVAELRVAGLIEATSLAGQPAYRATASAEQLAARLRE